MSLMDTFILALFFTFILIFILVLINAIYFYSLYYKELSKKIDGKIFDGGFLFSASRFMLWGHFCISSKKAERSGVKEIFEELPKRARRQLIFHWCGMMYCCLVLFGLGIWAVL